MVIIDPEHHFDADVAVVGAGVIGCAIAREMSRYNATVIVIDKAEDVCCGTSKANSGIVHAGFDCVPGTKKARYNVRGAELMPAVCAELDVPYKQTGSFVLTFDEADHERLYALKEQGEKNGVSGLAVISGDEARALEPCISAEVTGALYAPTAGIVDPFMLTVAFAENAAANGCEFRFNQKVLAVEPANGGWRLTTSKGVILARTVVNACGVHSAELYNVAPGIKGLINIVARRGCYQLLDRMASPVPNAVLFQLPTALGKGVLVAPTCHGNTLVGPNAQDVLDKDDTETTLSELGAICEKAKLSVPEVPLNQTITNFAGLRASEAGHDFVIEETSPGYVHAAGIESPGLTSAPAVGVAVAAHLASRLNAAPRKNFKATRQGVPKLSDCSVDERAALIAQNPAYGQIVCRCEQVSLGEIQDALAHPVPPTTLDGLKRRLRVGMGRCQGGFCLPRAIEALQGINVESAPDVRKSGPGSWVVASA